MGKHHRHRGQKKPASPSKNKEQLREAILKVFRARAQSPRGDGGILVGKAEQKQNDTGVPSSRRTVNDLHLSDNCSQGSASSSQKVKRLKTASERNKLRAKTQQEKSGRADFKKHLKRAEEITSHSKLGHTSNEGFSAITQNRLTVGLGLFNKGKKSHKIARDPIVLSQTVQDRTEKDLQRILELSRVQDDQKDTSFEMETKSKSGSRPNRAPVSNNSSIVCGNPQFSPGNTEMMSPAQICQSRTDSLDSSPALSDIAADLIASLKPKMYFQGTDYSKETSDELRRFMKQNRRMTPPQMKMTPINKISSATVKRSLIHSLPPPPIHADDCSLDCTEKMPKSSEIRCPQAKRDEDKTFQLDLSSYATSDPVSILALNDRIQQTKDHKPSTITSASQKSSHHGNSQREELWIQTLPESFQEPAGMCVVPMEVEITSDHLPVPINLHERNCYSRRQRPEDDIWGSSLPTGFRMTDPAEPQLLGNTIGNYPSYGQAVRTEYTYPPECFPTYYSAHEGDVWPHGANAVISRTDQYKKPALYHQDKMKDNMDILDYADTSSHYRNVKERHQDLVHNHHFCPAIKSPVQQNIAPNWLSGLPSRPSSHIQTPKGHFKRHALH